MSPSELIKMVKWNLLSYKNYVRIMRQRGLDPNKNYENYQQNCTDSSEERYRLAS